MVIDESLEKIRTLYRQNDSTISYTKKIVSPFNQSCTSFGVVKNYFDDRTNHSVDDVAVQRT